MDGKIYRFLGFSVAHVQQGMTASERRAGYAVDITYATQKEIGFDFLRDRIALRLDEQIHRKFHAAVIDEADSILIDEARVPLVIAGGEWGDRGLACVANQIAGDLLPGEHFTVDPGGHNVALSDAGIHAVESDWTRESLRRAETCRFTRRSRGAPRARLAASRHRLHRQRRGHRDDRRI